MKIYLPKFLPDVILNSKNNNNTVSLNYIETSPITPNVLKRSLVETTSTSIEIPVVSANYNSLTHPQGSAYLRQYDYDFIVYNDTTVKSEITIFPTDNSSINIKFNKVINNNFVSKTFYFDIKNIDIVIDRTKQFVFYAVDEDLTTEVGTVLNGPIAVTPIQRVVQVEGYNLKIENEQLLVTIYELDYKLERLLKRSLAIQQTIKNSSYDLYVASRVSYINSYNVFGLASYSEDTPDLNYKIAPIEKSLAGFQVILQPQEGILCNFSIKTNDTTEYTSSNTPDLFNEVKLAFHENIDFLKQGKWVLLECPDGITIHNDLTGNTLTSVEAMLAELSAVNNMFVRTVSANNLVTMLYLEAFNTASYTPLTCVGNNIKVSTVDLKTIQFDDTFPNTNPTSQRILEAANQKLNELFFVFDDLEHYRAEKSYPTVNYFAVKNPYNTILTTVLKSGLTKTTDLLTSSVTLTTASDSNFNYKNLYQNFKKIETDFNSKYGVKGLSCKWDINTGYFYLNSSTDLQIKIEAQSENNITVTPTIKSFNNLVFNKWLSLQNDTSIQLRVAQSPTSVTINSNPNLVLNINGLFTKPFDVYFKPNAYVLGDDFIQEQTIYDSKITINPNESVDQVLTKLFDTTLPFFASITTDTSDIYLNFNPKDKATYKNITCYCEQNGSRYNTALFINNKTSANLITSITNGLAISSNTSIQPNKSLLDQLSTVCLNTDNPVNNYLDTVVLKFDSAIQSVKDLKITFKTLDSSEVSTIAFADININNIKNTFSSKTYLDVTVNNTNELILKLNTSSRVVINIDSPAIQVLNGTYCFTTQQIMQNDQEIYSQKCHIVLDKV